MSGRIARLIQNYERHGSIPWSAAVAGPQRVWFAVYDKTDERRLRARVQEFEIATGRAGHSWVLADVTDAFPKWLASHEYRDSYFADPEAVESAMGDFLDEVAASLRAQLAAADDQTVIGLLGVGALFGFIKVSALVKAVQDDIRGRLLVFFPGTYENNTYRLLDARDGWNYMAIPITSDDGQTLP